METKPTLSSEMMYSNIVSLNNSLTTNNSTTLNPLLHQNFLEYIEHMGAVLKIEEADPTMDDSIIQGSGYCRPSADKLYPLRNKILDNDEFLNEKVEDPVVETFKLYSKSVPARIMGFYNVTESSLSRQREDSEDVNLALSIAYYPNPESNDHYKRKFQLTREGVRGSFRNTEPLYEGRPISESITIGRERPLDVSDKKYSLVVNDVWIGAPADSKMGRVGLIIRNWSALLEGGRETCTLLNVSCPFDKVSGTAIEQVVAGQSVEYQLKDSIRMYSDIGQYVISLEKLQ